MRAFDKSEAEIKRRQAMLRDKINFCIYCGVPGESGRTQQTGELHHGNMVGAGSPPSNFPGDPTLLEYFGSGASAYVYFHPACVPSQSRTETVCAACAPEIAQLRARIAQLESALEDEGISVDEALPDTEHGLFVIDDTGEDTAVSLFSNRTTAFEAFKSETRAVVMWRLTDVWARWYDGMWFKREAPKKFIKQIRGGT